MKAKLLVVSLSLIIAAACSKDKFGTKPVLTFEGINGTTFAEGQNIQIKLRLTDKEGDFYSNDSTGYTKPYLYFKRYSFKSDCRIPEDTMPTLYDIPAFPTNKFLDAELDLQYTYGITGQYSTLNGCLSNVPQNDSTYFKIWILDDAGHVSDTVTTPYFRLLSIN